MLREIDGNITRNTAATRPTGTGKPQISLVVRVRVELVAIDPVAVGLEIVQVAVEDSQVAEPETVPVVEELERVQGAAELEIVPVEVELEHDQAAVELEIVQVAAELEIVPVVAELEHVPVVAELELVRAAVPLRTKSVIAPHHRDLVPVLVAEDLAAEVETMREPAAAEAVIAWEVAE